MQPNDSLLQALQSKGHPIDQVLNDGNRYRIRFIMPGTHKAAMHASIAISFALRELSGGPVEVKFEWTPDKGPITKGSEVQVVALTDETAVQAALGTKGRVVAVKRGRAGVGDSRSDPFFTVRFADGHQDGFWGEELVKIG